MKTSSIKPPAHISQEARKWFESVVADYELEPHHVKLLTLAAESWDRATQARLAIAEHGITYTDRFGSPRKRPEVSVEESARIAFARLCRELDLSEDSVPDNRPPAIRSNKG